MQSHRIRLALKTEDLIHWQSSYWAGNSTVRICAMHSFAGMAQDAALVITAPSFEAKFASSHGPRSLIRPFAPNRCLEVSRRKAVRFQYSSFLYQYPSFCPWEFSANYQAQHSHSLTISCVQWVSTLPQPA